MFLTRQNAGLGAGEGGAAMLRNLLIIAGPLSMNELAVALSYQRQWARVGARRRIDLVP